MVDGFHFLVGFAKVENVIQALGHCTEGENFDRKLASLQSILHFFM